MLANAGSGDNGSDSDSDSAGAPSVLATVGSLPQRILPAFSIAGLVTLSLSVALLALFLIHQLTIWISLDPERAFENSKALVQLYQSGYDTTANLWNAFNEVLLVALPAWNSVVMYKF